MVMANVGWSVWVAVRKTEIQSVPINKHFLVMVDNGEIAVTNRKITKRAF